ncbi:hypothetical protein ABPG75_001796 [Micractinium tetrahymenae]
MSVVLLLLLTGLAAVAAAGSDKQDFLARFPDYGYGPITATERRIDELWQREIAPRMPPGETYLDYTGSTLYLNSQLEAALKELEAGIYGNPHSINPSSLRTEGSVEALRARVLEFLGADPEVYDVVWTRSGTGALRELGETFPWSLASRFAYLVSNHNSVLGIREYARVHNASFGAVTEEDVEAWIAGSSVAGKHSGRGGLPGILQEAEEPEQEPQQAAGWDQLAGSSTARRQLRTQPAASGATAVSLRPGEAAQLGLEAGRGSSHHQEAKHAGHPAHDNDEPTYSLFAFPAYDNYAGLMYPLHWVKAIQAKSTRRHRWKVLIDAAAFLPTHPLNLTETPADAVCISFYKLFGYPSGIGALVARKEDLRAARKEYWGGGSVFLATASLDWKHFRPQGAERFEDGTLAFLSIMGLQQGLDMFASLGGAAAIERHTSALRAWMFEQLSALVHSNGAPLLRIFGRHHWPNSREVQGATFNFQILMPNGTVFSYRNAATALAEAGFSLRCGCTCNPGACYGLLGVRDEEVRDAAELAHGNFSDWEWVWVKRRAEEAGAVPHGGTAPLPGRPHTRLVKLPLGSLRASLGYMARYEDGKALVDFLRAHYRDRTRDEFSLEEVQASAAAAGLALAGGGGRRQERLQWAAPERQGPGWC